MLGGDQGRAEEVETEMSTNPLTTFVALMTQEMEQAAAPDPSKKDDQTQNGDSKDVVIDDSQCKR
jgi:hypothetical protein